MNPPTNPDKIRIPKKSELATEGTGKKFLGVNTTHGVCMVATKPEGLRKSKDGTIYVIYPDGSYRRCTPRRIKFDDCSLRTRQREESAIVRGTAYLKQAK